MRGTKKADGTMDARRRAEPRGAEAEVEAGVEARHQASGTAHLSGAVMTGPRRGPTIGTISRTIPGHSRYQTRMTVKLSSFLNSLREYLIKV